VADGVIALIYGAADARAPAPGEVSSIGRITGLSGTCRTLGELA
jgi:hypothetical protein